MKRIWGIALMGLMLIAMNVNATTRYINVPLTAATYLGGSGGDSFNGVEIAPDSTIFIAGRMPGYNPPGITPIALNGGGQGALIRFASDGRSILSVTRIGAWISDLEINPSGVIVICGSFGMVTLSADGTTIAQTLTTVAQDRCAIGTSGATVGLNDSSEQVTVFNAAGAPTGTWNGNGRNYADVAIHTETNRVIVTGYLQATSTLQTPVLQAFDISGAQQWAGYAFTASQVTAQNLGADSRGVRVAIGKDGKIYLAGRTDGGNTVFTRQPNAITSPLPNTILIKFDRFNDPFNLGSGSFAWYGRFDPALGTLERAQFLITRKDDTKGNSLAIHAITADANGVVYLGGEAYYQIENRSNRTLAGLGVGGYEGGEPFMAAISADFGQRLFWTPFAAAGHSAGESPMVGIAARGQMAIGVATLNLSNPSRRLITLNPVQATIGGGTSDGYLALWQNNFTPPQTPTLLTPLLEANDQPYNPTFNWSGGDSTAYRLIVRDATGVTVIRRNFAANTCPSQICSYTHDGILPNGAYTWFVTATNDLTAVRSVRGRFTVAFPGRPTLQAPINGAHVSPLPTFTWTDLAAADEYRLTVIRNSTGLVYFRTPWLAEASVCTSGICNFTPSQAFRQGGFSWLIEARAAGIPNRMKTGRATFRVIP